MQPANSALKLTGGPRRGGFILFTLRLPAARRPLKPYSLGSL
jgi:hypothetical protein